MTMLRTHRAAVLGVPTLALALALTACTGDSGSDKQSPAEVLAASKTLMDETPGLRLALTTDKLPAGVDGVLKATGVGTHAPAFQGDLTVLVNSLSVDVPVVAVDGAVYAKLPFTSVFAEVDPGDYGAPDPADLMDPDEGISNWLTAVTDPTKGGQVRDGKAVLTEYTGSLPGSAVASVIPSADAKATFPVTFQLNDEGRLESVEVSGPFYGGKGIVEYTIALSDYGTDQEITKP